MIISNHQIVIAASYKGGDVASYLLLISKQHGGNCIEKIAKHGGSHADYVFTANSRSKKILSNLRSQKTCQVFSEYIQLT